MSKLYPFLYKISICSCGSLTSIPFDILQTKIISNQEVKFKLEEIKFILFMNLLFLIQNNFYNSNIFKNKTLKAALSGIIISPFYIILEIKKNYLRMGLYPKYEKFIFWITLKQIIFFTTLYNIFESNINYSQFLSAFIANSLGFLLKIIALKKSYINLNLDCENIKKIALIEIFKSSIGDMSKLYLIYNFKYSQLE